uniref:Glucosidase 2 subunit beta n=1 Tax=Chloropicon primus TaxID=1764295 RepID=A0A7S2T3J0_9CHLO|mmetsp:Transcript_5478/g.16627  ORF Transcript_5478/g.16627 Transcript_5478/m.16627 type:complete len:554 (+) Transcript_5478:437-2098(+)
MKGRLRASLFFIFLVASVRMFSYHRKLFSGGRLRGPEDFDPSLLSSSSILGGGRDRDRGGGAADVLRGVSPSTRKAYEAALRGGEGSSPSFACFDGSKVLAPGALNDNYCDCEDGSDEPGTSACANGSFYCQNLHHKPKTLSSMFVDDGVCDCCDGSDERGGGCENTCAEEGSELRKELQKEIRAMEQGLKEKTAMMSRTTVDKEETAKKVALVEKKINATSILVEKLETKIKVLNEALLEEEEKKRAQEKEGELIGEEGEDYDEEEEEDKEYEEEEEYEEDEETETDEDVGRKIASRWTRDPDAAQKDGSGGEDRASEPETEGSEPKKPESWDEEEDGPWEAPAKANDAEDDFDYDTFQKETETIESDSGKGDNSFLSIFKKGVDIVKSVFEKSEFDKVQSELNKQTDELKKMKAELKKMKDLIQLDFGENNKFLNFYGQCFKKVIEKYTYEVCPFGTAKQDHTSLGTYQGLSEDQKTFVFSNGAKCWNGPHRSIRVNLLCGTKNEITKVGEPSVCEYSADFTTPVACEEGELEAKRRDYKFLTEGKFHDEL